MAQGPTTPKKTLRTQAPRDERPGIANADVPSETVGLPGVGEGASAAHFARDTVEWQAAEGDDSHGTPTGKSSDRAG